MYNVLNVCTTIDVPPSESDAMKAVDVLEAIL